MPRSQTDVPRFALAAGLDARSFEGTVLTDQQLFKRGAAGDPVSMPDWADGEGIFSCIVAFLNGFGSAVSMDVADLTFGLDADDRVTITNGSGATSYTLTAQASNAIWGLPVDATVIGPSTTYTAPSDWQRGLVQGATAPRLAFTSPGLNYAPAEPGYVQDIRTMLRHRGSVSDLDDTGADTLEDLDNAVNDSGDEAFRWFVTDDGYVGWTGTSANADEDLVWLSTAFRDMLGFDGTETTQEGGGSEYYCIANRPCPLIFVPRRPLIRQVLSADQIGDALRLTDGRFSAVHTGTYPKQRLEFWIEGPQDVGGTDYHRHWIRFRSLTPRGWPVTLYQDWGDSRRALGIEAITSTQDAYDLLYTSQRNGLYGRIVGYVHPDTEDPTVDFDGWFRIRARGSFVIATGERFNG